MAVGPVGNAGEPVTVEDDVEFQVQSYQFGYRLILRNPLWVNDDVVQAHGLGRLISTRCASGICICSGAAAKRPATPASSRSKN